MSPLEEGWYLMSVHDLEVELALWRGEPRSERSSSIRLSIADALAYKAAGNVPDHAGRSLRLVLFVDDEDVGRVGEKRIVWEPDLHDPPTWRHEGSVPVNIVPLRRESRVPRPDDSWLDDPALAALEDEWHATGAVGGVRIPEEYRGFVYKTILALRASGLDVTVPAIVGSVQRWLGSEDARALQAALEAVND